MKLPKEHVSHPNDKKFPKENSCKMKLKKVKNTPNTSPSNECQNIDSFKETICQVFGNTTHSDINLHFKKSECP
jgi:hypothetical protein